MSKIGIFVGTVYGNALAVAEEAETIFIDQGHKVTVFDEPTLNNWLEYNDGESIALIITSSTGQGDLPDSITPLYTAINDQLGYQPNLRYGIIALGDASYDHFCGAGLRFDALLTEQSATRIGDMLLIDGMEEAEPEEFAKPWLKQWGETLV
nr:flavodoxin [uncultured Moellerella sp.]